MQTNPTNADSAQSMDRHRDKHGPLAKKHGHTFISTLRKVYGAKFAEACEPHAKLEDVLATLDEHSLTRVVHDVDGGRLDEKIAASKE